MPEQSYEPSKPDIGGNGTSNDECGAESLQFCKERCRFLGRPARHAPRFFTVTSVTTRACELSFLFTGG